MKAIPHDRCFCMWQCACVCVGLVARADASDQCEEMPIGAIYEAGFVTDEPRLQDEVFNWFGIVHLLLAFLCVMLLFGKSRKIFVLKSIFIRIQLFNRNQGFCKAFCGCFCRGVGKWKYDYLQPNEPFKEASKYVLYIYLFHCIIVRCENQTQTLGCIASPVTVHAHLPFCLTIDANVGA